jgi:hypothetical protein
MGKANTNTGIQERDWMSIVDGGDPVSATWEPSPEYGNGTWRAQLPYQPWAMSVDFPSCPTLPHECSKSIWRIGTDAMHENYSFAPGQSDNYLSGANAFNKGAQEEVQSYYTNMPVKYWDGIEALFGYKNGWTYLRFRNGDNPNGKKLYISPGPVTTYQKPSVGTFTFNNAAYITLEDMRIRGGRNAVLITNNSTRIYVDNSHLSNGNSRVTIDTGSTANFITNNTLVSNHISGWIGGARYHDGNYAPYSRVKNWHLYFVQKFTVGDLNEDDHGVWLNGHGKDNYIDNNVICDSAVGIDTVDGTTEVSTIIRNNLIRHQIAQGLFVERGTHYTYIYNNRLIDNAIGIRAQELELNSHSAFIYNNMSWQPYGEHVFVHGTNPSGAPTSSYIWLYHNSFSGPVDGTYDVNISERITSAQNFVFVNNIFASGGLSTNWGIVGELDHNLIPVGASIPGNITATSKPWGDGLPNFYQVPSQAANAGENLAARGFVLVSTPIKPLPDLGVYYDGGDTPTQW